MKLAGAALRRFLEAPDRHVGAALVFGPNRALCRETAEALAVHALGGVDDPFAVTRLEEAELKKDRGRLEQALLTQSLLGGPTLVRVRAEGESAAEPILAALERIESGAPAAFLLVEGGELPAKGKLARAFEAARRAVAAVFYDPSEEERTAYAHAALKAAELRFEPGAAEAFVALLPTDQGLMRQEIDKLSLYAHGLDRAVGLAEATALLAAEAEAALDEAGLAALAGRAGPAIEALDRLDGVNGVAAIKALERRLLRLIEARGHLDRGMTLKEAGDRLRPKLFWREADAFAAQMRVWSYRRTLEGLGLMWRAEVAAKTAGAPHMLLAADAYRAVAGLALR